MSSDALENIRLRSNEIGEGRSSTTKTALIVPGGVLRSICNCGALAALNSLKINYFDTVFGVSAGALNAAYFLANQSALAVTVYLEEANRLRFINPFRFWNIMNLDYLFTEVVQGSKRLDITALQTNRSQLRILTADISRNRSNWFTADRSDVLAIMKGACSTEVPSSRPTLIGESLCRDGYLLEPLPLLSALKENYSDILVLLNRPLAERDTPFPAWLQKLIINPWNRRIYGVPLARTAERSWESYNQALDLIHAGAYQNSEGAQTRIAAIAPEKETAVGMFETNNTRLFKAASSSWVNTMKAFGASDGSASAFLNVLREAGLKRTTLTEM